MKLIRIKIYHQTYDLIFISTKGDRDNMKRTHAIDNDEVNKTGLFFGHFQKTQGPKNSTSKKTQGHFLPKNSICRDFLRLHIKNSMQMTSISVHCLKQMVSIDNYKEDNIFPLINKWIITTQPT